MAIDVVMPRLGWTMEEGTLVEWLRQPGDTIAVGETLFTVESEKALTEVESMDAGRLHIPANAPGPGDTVAVGTVIAFLLAEGEEGPATVPDPAAVPESAAAVAPARDKPAAEPVADGNEPAAPAAVSAPISPRARKLARELGVDYQHLTGSGRTGRITEDDIRAAAENSSGASVESGTALSPLRRAIAQRLSASHRDGAPVTLTAEVDATALVAWRQQARPRLSINDCFIRFVAQALGQHPALNSQLQADSIVQPEGIHVGYAVDTDKGLVVPVIHDAQDKTVEQIARESAALSRRALSGELTGPEMADGTFTITNLGAAGIDAFTPIVNPPQCAILGVGRIAQRPAVHDGQVVARWLCVVSLTFDHRIVDGGPASRFLATLRELVEAAALD